jgi:hypothetical protein
MSADIIRFIPRPRRSRGTTDFPTIAFRSAVRDAPTRAIDVKASGVKASVARDDVTKPPLVRRDPILDQLDTAPSEYVPSDWSEK